MIPFLIITLICWSIFIFCFRKDRSRYRNIYLLFIAILSSLLFFINISDYSSRIVAMIIAYIIIFSILLVPYFLIHNGIVMLKKEGKSIPHILSLVLGIVILLGEISFIGMIISNMFVFRIEDVLKLHQSFIYKINIIFGVTILYSSISVLMFVLYQLLLQIIPFNKKINYVVIFGSGLIDGDKVSKLLSDRIDKAITIYNSLEEKPKIVPSGGQGKDEKISEAEAMKRYLIEKGIPKKDILLEDKSTTTKENLLFSKKLIEKQKGDKNIALVSNNYHIYRALRHARKIGLKCTGVGGHTAFYYWPCAILREYIAVHTEKKEMILLVLGWIISMIITLLIIF